MIEGLPISRILDLSIPADQRYLREAASSHPELLSLIEEYVDEYLSLFPQLDWRRVYSGGMLSIPTTRKHSISFDLLQMLRLAKSLKKLTPYSGYEKLVSGFRNPTQINSTYFEAVVGSWCVDRDVSVSIEFSPEVTVKGKCKRPDFLWHTRLGNLYCECKRNNLLESKLNARVEKLLSWLSMIYEEYGPWDASLRLDVRFERGSTNRIRDRFRTVVAQASAALKDGTHAGQTFREDDVSAVLRCRNEPVPQERESIQASIAKVGPVAQNLAEATHLNLRMSLAKYRQESVGRLLRDARTQLPPDSPSAVFVELGGYEAAQQKLQRLVGRPAYASTPWVSLWVHGEISSAIWQNGQQFDDRLLLTRP